MRGERREERSGSSTMAEDQKPHIAILQTPGMGHLIPLAEFAKRLVLHHGFTATFITFSDFSSHAQTDFLDSLPAGLSYVTLPPFPLDDLVPAGAHVETRLGLTVARSVPHVRDFLSRLKATTRLAAYVVDLFGTDTIDVAQELGIPHYLFFTTTFMVLSFMLHLPALHEATMGEYRDLPEPVALPGCVAVRGPDLWHPVQDRTDDAYRWGLHAAKGLRKAQGILVNSFVAIEPETYRVLKEEEPGRPPVYPVGPLIWSKHDGSGNHHRPDSACLEWLDRQPPGSVLFVSFGSGGTLSTVQVAELAAGLEASGQRFLWVVRCPSDRESSGTFFSLKSVDDDPLSYLPEGFLNRIEGVGMVVPLWAPQVEVLSHPSTGGFLTHCGWNSTLEGLVYGVPMISWPLYAEQGMNATMLSGGGVGVALRVVVGDDGVVRREEIGKVAKELMESEGGRRARGKARELKEAAAMAMEKGGTSYEALDFIADKWRNTK